MKWSNPKYIPKLWAPIRSPTIIFLQYLNFLAQKEKKSEDKTLHVLKSFVRIPREGWKKILFCPCYWISMKKHPTIEIHTFYDMMKYAKNHLRKLNKLPPLLFLVLSALNNLVLAIEKKILKGVKFTERIQFSLAIVNKNTPHLLFLPSKV